MTAAVIIKNIFEFAKILNCASRDEVLEWNDVSIHNAISWSNHCQEIYRFIKDKGFEEDVNHQLHQFTLFLEPVSCVRLSVESLGKAKYILVKALLTNPKFPTSSKQMLRDIILKHQEDAWILQKVDERSGELEQKINVCMKIFDLTKSEACRGQTDEMSRLKMQLQAKTLTQHFVKLYSETNRFERFRKYCQSFCDELSKTIEGWCVMINMLCTFQDSSLDLQDKLNDVQSYVIDWIKQSVEQDVANSSLWQLDVKLLSKASCDNEDFFHVYLSSLTVWADRYTPVVETGCKVVWCSLQGYSSEVLSQHFKQLLLDLSPSYKSRKAKVLETIIQNVRSTCFTVWPVVAQSLILLLK